MLNGVNKYLLTFSVICCAFQNIQGRWGHAALTQLLMSLMELGRVEYYLHSNATSKWMTFLV